MAIEFFTVSRNFNDIFKELQKSYGQNISVITIDGHQGVRFSIGSVEKGIIYTVLPINNARTLFIKRSYLGEGIDVVSEKSSDFINLLEQKALFEQVLSTFTFRPTI
jgi:hypothetical protein